MIYQPILTDSLSKIEEIRTFAYYKNDFVDSGDPEHIHNCYEIYVNVSGNVSYLHNKSIYPIEPGDIIIAAPGEVHYCIFHSSCVHEHFCLWFDADEKSAVSSFINRHKLTGHIRLDSSMHNKLFMTLHRFDSEKDPFERTMCFLELLRLMAEKNTEHTAENAGIPDKMQEILEFVDENYADIHFIEEIADRFHISIPTLNRWFRQYVHLSPSKLLTAKKLSYAEKLLRGDYSVADACFMAGFADCSRFIAMFKGKYGLTPLQYKKQQL